MLGSSKSGRNTRSSSRSKEKPTWDVPVFFGIMFLLSIAELFFSVDSFQYLQRKHKWHSKTERARLAFLMFSSARTILLSAVYCGFHCARKHFHSIFHTVFLVISTILWIVSGVLIHQMWGVIDCNEGVGNIRDGLSECHELKIIEIIAWVLAGVSVLATVPVVMNAMKRRKRQAERKTHTSG
ncbi:hypothetical protein BKA65DRAFT_265125 [Rhexocercosporidium sp. MPI-PUGE-AT-0058]|nr:hypothetical protein BKA65DRAFT_265125 [Rhexocercosporidium sp. MPI-PUGE-AT-0058]